MEKYREAITHARETLVAAILELEEDVEAKAPGLDSLLRDLLRQVGHGVLVEVYGRLAERVTAGTEVGGLIVQHRRQIEVMTVFGRVHIESPYLWSRSGSARPVRDRLGLWHRARTDAVERALTDFGAEESFAQASRRFEEHYGFPVGRTTVLRVVESHAMRAESYVEQRLGTARAEYGRPLAERPGADQMLVELDGCEIRTGVLKPVGDGSTTEVRHLPRRTRTEAWRDVRVGLARPLDQINATCVARLDSYAAVTSQIFSVACERGLSSRTEVVAVADGGNGLREELQSQFPGSQFIYDRPHAKQHLYDTADAMGLRDAKREEWVADTIGRIDAGRAETVIERLGEHKGRGKARVLALRAHLRRFADAMDYDRLKARGLPIGSGEVESAHRTIPQKRLKLPGAWWRPDTVNPMLALRVMRHNGWWADYWTEIRAAA